MQSLFFFGKLFFLLLLPPQKPYVMKIKTFFILGVLLLTWALTACQDKTKTGEGNEIEMDTLTVFEHVLERGKLVAVTNCGEINYNENNEKPSGFEYDLLNDFCSTYGLELELLVEDNMDSCFKMLDSMKVDVVAAGLGVTKENRKRYLMTNPILSQRCVLVQRLPKGWNAMSTDNEVENQLLRSPLDLAGKTVYVAKGSFTAQVLEHLSDGIGDTIYIKECDTLNGIELVEAVSEGQIDYTVVEEYVAKMASIGQKGLDTKLVVSVEQPIGWAMLNQDADSSLLNAVNTWIESVEQRHLRRMLAKYVNNGRQQRSKLQPGQLSEFDPIIKKTAKDIGWDWRLLASVIYQESHFKLDLESEKGAFGLMQLMPVVMERYEITYDSSPEEQLEAGGKLISYLDGCFENRVFDSTERVKFVLAAYNAGLGHVYDAQRLASKYGKDPEVWDNNVDYFILNKSKPQYYNDTCCKAGYLRGTETYRFVEEVLDRYYQYQATYN